MNAEGFFGLRHCFVFGFFSPLNHWKVRGARPAQEKGCSCLIRDGLGKLGVQIPQPDWHSFVWVSTCGWERMDSSCAVKQLPERDGSALLLLLHRWVLPGLCCGLAQLVAEEE